LGQLKLNIDIAFLSTYPLRDCGIAAFTEELITSMGFMNIINTHIIAMNNTEDYSFDKKVMAQIRQNEKIDYINMALKLNASNIKLLVIEHEFGIYGGDQGEYILDLINNLEIPVVTTLHTILQEPNPKQRLIINELGKKSERIVTMENNTKEILRTIYGVEASKIEMIPHGVSKKPFEARDILKKEYGFENKQIISTFGFIGPEKGIEHGIEAIANVVKSHTISNNKVVKPENILYLILGPTHPEFMEEGTAYRNKLKQLINRLDINKNVKFVNKYLSKDEMIQYMNLTDIYMTPYLSKYQAVSSNLAYAVGYGKAIVSTPYLYAKEMLSEGNGLLAEFSNPDTLSDCIKQILENPFKKATLERKTIKIGRTMYWDKIASQYATLFTSIINASIPEIGEVL
jgi:polysaccharide biosynthesis protein PslF